MADRAGQAASETVKPSPTCVAFHQGCVSIPLGHPAHHVGVVVERQLRPAMEVHRRRHRHVGDGRLIGAEVGASAQARVHDAGELVEIGRLAVEHCGVRPVAEKRLDAVLDQMDVAGREPGAAFPEQPAVHVGPGREVGGIGARIAHLVGGVLHDRVRFPEDQVAVAHHRDRGVRIDRHDFRALLVALEVVDPGERIVGTDQLEAGEHLAAVHRDRISNDLHRRLPCRAGAPERPGPERMSVPVAAPLIADAPCPVQPMRAAAILHTADKPVDGVILAG